MRKLFSLFLVLPFFVFANHVGEFANYDLSVQGLQGTLKVQVSSFDNSNSTYSITTTTEIAGSRNAQNEIVTSSDIMTHESALQVIQYCSLLPNAVLENVTFAGKTYQTCKMPMDEPITLMTLVEAGFPTPKDLSGFVWMGDFPIQGVFKAISGDYKITLRSMKWNN